MLIVHVRSLMEPSAWWPRRVDGNVARVTLVLGESGANWKPSELLEAAYLSVGVGTARVRGAAPAPRMLPMCCPWGGLRALQRRPSQVEVHPAAHRSE